MASLTEGEEAARDGNKNWQGGGKRGGHFL